MYSFNIILTERCNAKCSHCYMRNDTFPKLTLSKNQVDLIINKLPKNTKRIILTGGEIFLEKDLLMYSINKIKKFNSDIEIDLESNGIYFYKNDNPLKLLKELEKSGISSIRFSDDPFHKSGGVDLEKVRKIKEYQKDVKFQIKYLVQEKAFGIGQAKKLSDDRKNNANCMNHASTKSNPYFFLDIRGNVYLCAWKCIAPIGNMFVDDMNTIIERLKDEFNSLILVGKIEEAYALINNDKKEEYKNYTRCNGQCMLCAKLNEKRT